MSKITLCTWAYLQENRVRIDILYGLNLNLYCIHETVYKTISHKNTVGCKTIPKKLFGNGAYYYVSLLQKLQRLLSRHRLA